VINAVSDLGELNNTLIIYIQGDNGASAEGTLLGRLTVHYRLVIDGTGSHHRHSSTIAAHSDELRRIWQTATFYSGQRPVLDLTSADFKHIATLQLDR
jgi:arylsulfatase A-like enzyme